MGDHRAWTIWRCTVCGQTDSDPGRLDDRDWCESEDAHYEEIEVVPAEDAARLRAEVIRLTTGG